MITILPEQGDLLAQIRRVHPSVTDLLVMKDGEERLGTIGVCVEHSVLDILLFEVSCEEETGRRFIADSLLRAAASLAANRGAYRLSCSLPEWSSFLCAEGFREEEGRFVLPTEHIVKFCKD